MISTAPRRLLNGGQGHPYSHHLSRVPGAGLHKNPFEAHGKRVAEGSAMIARSVSLASSRALGLACSKQQTFLRLVAHLSSSSARLPAATRADVEHAQRGAAWHGWTAVGTSTVEP